VGGHTAERCAEADTAVRLGGKVATVTIFAGQVDAPAAVRAVAYALPEVGAMHGSNLVVAR